MADEKNDICAYSVRLKCQRPAVAGREYCIFHDSDPNKDVQVFQESLEAELGIKGKLNFEGFRFPEDFKIDFFQGRSLPEITLADAVFRNTVSFNSCLFQSDADFSFTEFTDKVTFAKAIFSKDHEAKFFLTRFPEAMFIETDFQGRTDFGGARFLKTAYFSGTHFSDVSFLAADFRDTAWFNPLRNTRISVFLSKAHFNNTFFAKNAYFQETDFIGQAKFLSATFEETADFSDASFLAEDLETDFSRTKFNGFTSFENVSFCGRSRFEVESLYCCKF